MLCETLLGSNQRPPLAALLYQACDPRASIYPRDAELSASQNTVKNKVWWPVLNFRHSHGYILSRIPRATAFLSACSCLYSGCETMEAPKKPARIAAAMLCAVQSATM